MWKARFKVISNFLAENQSLWPGKSLVVFVFKFNSCILHCINGLGALGFLVSVNYIVGTYF